MLILSTSMNPQYFFSSTKTNIMRRFLVFSLLLMGKICNLVIKFSVQEADCKIIYLFV
jgi:hypothetical protein